MSAKEKKNGSINFHPIRVSTLRGDQKIKFNAYLRINGKHLLYCRSGDSFEGPRLKRLKEKKLKKMYIVPDDESHYQNYIRKNLEEAYDNSQNKDILTRSEIIQGHQESIAEDIMENPQIEEYYNLAKDSSGKFRNFLLSNKDAVKAVLSVANSENSLAHHGVNVSTLAIGIAEKIGYVKEDHSLVDLMALGCLIHDIEHQYTGLNIAQKLETMDANELKLYSTHPLDGARRVQRLKHFDQIVINIIMQHEELIDGSGFPNGLSEKDVDPMVVIASTANAYDRLISLEKLSHKEALQALLVEKIGLHPLKQMKALQEILKEQKLI